MPDGTVMQVPRGTPKDEVFQQWKASQPDPSAGGGTLQVGPWDTGIKTPESVDRFLSGAGKAFFDVGRGVGQLFGKVSREDVEATRQLDAPLMGTKAGVLGNVAGNVAMTSPLFAVPGANTITGSAAIGGGLGLLQPVTGDESRATNAVVGGVAGGGVTAGMKGLGRVVQPVRSSPGVADRRALATLDSAGVPTDAAQRTGSAALQRVKASLSDNPVTVGGQVTQIQKQQTAFNRAVLQKIGVQADMADERAMGQAKARIGQVFNDVLDRTSIRFNTADAVKARAIEAQAKRRLGNDPRISNIIADISDYTKQNAGKVDGRYYQTIRQDIAALEREPNIGPIARDLRETLDDAFQRAASPNDAAALQEARRQWRNMRVIEAAVAKDGSGNISPSILANQFGQKANRTVGVYGQGDKSVLALARLAKAGKRVIPEKLPNSGTTPRAVMQAALPAAIGAAYGGYREGDATGVLMGAAGGVLAPKLAQKLINSPTGINYLSRGIAPGLRSQIPQGFRNALIAPQAVGATALPAYLLAQPSQ
jgi:hypothetical protein